MDRRNPDCKDAQNSRRPWSLGSGAPCRNDEENLCQQHWGWGEGKLNEALLPHSSIAS